ncbi:MAG: DUF6653 family protein [Pseudonocardiaceae bacterium]
MGSSFGHLKRTMFARHSNPWSAWTRWASTPLVLVPFWTRQWRHAVPVVGWMLVNPVAFPRPESNDAWATRAMRGEELWIAERPRDRAAIVNLAVSVCGVGAVLAARKRRLVPTAALTLAEMALLLVYWKLMVKYYDENAADPQLDPALAGAP